MVGLGNPGREYERTRHNAGFMVVDELAHRFGISSWKSKDSALQATDAPHRAVLVKPTSFMNLSGTPVRLISSWYRTPAQDVLVIVDEMDLPFGRLKLQPSGGHGGHNGMRSVIATIGNAFPRLRVGVGRPVRESIDHVLSPFTSEESRELPSVVGAAADAVELWLDHGIERAMQFVNNWSLTSP